MHDRKSLAYAPSASGPRARANARAGHLSRSEHQAGQAVRARQRILAAFLPITAVLYISCEALFPRGTDQVATNMAVAFRLLPIAAAHSSQLYLAGSLSLLALGGLAVSYEAIALLITGRGWVIATVAALVGAAGAFTGALLNVLVGVNLAAAASAHIGTGAAAHFLVTSFGSGPALAAQYVYIASEYTAPVLMGMALWRSRAVPRWLAVLFTVGLEAAEAMGSYGPIVVLFMLPFAAAMILLAARIWQAAARPAAPHHDTAPTPSATPDSAATPLRTSSGS
ncbi:MAG: hypothetical protein ACRDRJ_06335 [Streptosporangiaceae bacterium]